MQLKRVYQKFIFDTPSCLLHFDYSNRDNMLVFRANRQFIISSDAIRRVHNYFNFKLKVELKGDPKVEIVVSRMKTAAFKAWMKGDKS
jgi:hypothetical protein